MVIKVLHNMNVKVKNISIRIESDGTGSMGNSTFNVNNIYSNNKNDKE